MLALTLPTPLPKTQTDTGSVAPACRASDLQFVSPEDALAAARLCRGCGVADACLRAALTLDAAFRRGEDPVGVSGVYAGVWFDPDHLPHRVGTPPGPRRRRTTRSTPGRAQ